MHALWERQSMSHLQNKWSRACHHFGWARSWRHHQPEYETSWASTRGRHQGVSYAGHVEKCVRVSECISLASTIQDLCAPSAWVCGRCLESVHQYRHRPPWVCPTQGNPSSSQRPCTNKIWIQTHSLNKNTFYCYFLPEKQKRQGSAAAASSLWIWTKQNSCC